MKLIVCLMGCLAFAGNRLVAVDDTTLERALRADVNVLAAEIGPRALYQGDSLKRAEKYIADELAQAGWVVRRETYTVGGMECTNLVTEKPGKNLPAEIVIVGAHYDTVSVTPGADDNASGVATLLALAREMGGASPERTLRLVVFTNEEPIYFQTEFMGSRVHARGCKARDEQVVAMLSLECLGYFTEAQKTQKYPFPLSMFYPSRGNFVAVVGNRESKALVKRVKRGLLAAKTIPSESIAMPDLLPGIGWSDHWSFWQEGYAAVMLTDTALNRNRNYHRPSDTADTLNYPQMVATTRGVFAVVQDLAGR